MLRNLDEPRKSKKINEQSQVNPAQLNNLKREWATLEIQRCFLVDEENEPYSFDFEIETNGLMSVPAVVHRGIREIKVMLQKYQTLDMQIPANVRIQPTLGHRKGVEVIFVGVPSAFAFFFPGKVNTTRSTFD